MVGNFKENLRGKAAWIHCVGRYTAGIAPTYYGHLKRALQNYNYEDCEVSELRTSTTLHRFTRLMVQIPMRLSSSMASSAWYQRPDSRQTR